MKAYSKDLRQKIVDTLRRGMSKAQAARTFGVGISTVKRYATKAQKGEPLEPAKAPGKRPKMGMSGSGSSSKRILKSARSSPLGSAATT